MTTLSRQRGRQGKYKTLDTFEEKGLTSIRRLASRITAKPFQIRYWADEGFISEAPESVKRREGLDGGMRYFDSVETVKTVYMSFLVNEVGLNAKIASKFAEILKTKEEPDIESKLHWIVIKEMVIGVPHLGGLDEVRVRRSRRIGQSVARQRNQSIRRTG